jgi:uncharacterized glyoxalase superfamily protein PhnB
VHVRVRDLAAALRWFAEVLDAAPGYRDAEMAVLEFEGASVILDLRETDDGVTIAFVVDHCDAAFDDAIRRGATAVEPPEDKTYGVRAAYVKGPGAMTIEFEQAL